MDLELVRNLGVALALGLLVGLQREWSRSKVAGLRTFALIALFGALCAIMAEATAGGLIIAAGLVAVAGMFWLGNWMRLAGGHAGPGLTTEMAGLVMYCVGGLVALGYLEAGVVTTGAVAALLHWKEPLHERVQRLESVDVRAVVRLAIIGMVILPVMPNVAYGPYGVLNPFEIWLMVVLIVGISMLAYVILRIVGAGVGTWLAGVLGGLISSTATTIAYARRSRAAPGESASAAIVLMVASTVVFGRVLIEIAVVAPSLMESIALPLGVMMAYMAAISAAAYVASRSQLVAPERGSPPAELRAAVAFGLLYAAVLFGVAAVKQRFGDTGLYVVAGLSGLTDMDAITLSSAQLMKAGTIDVATGWRVVVVGAMANLAFKLGAVALLGHARLRWRMALLFGLAMAGGVALIALWPV